MITEPRSPVQIARARILSALEHHDSAEAIASEIDVPLLTVLQHLASFDRQGLAKRLPGQKWAIKNRKGEPCQPSTQS